MVVETRGGLRYAYDAEAPTRKDRASLDRRPLRVELGAVAGSAGSCRLTLGGTEVVAAARLGAAARGEVLRCDVEVGPGAGGSSDAAAAGDAVARAVSPFLLTEALPKFAVDVRCAVARDDGGALVALVAAAGAALADAGVPLRDVPGAAAVAADAAGALLVDPTAAESAAAASELRVAAAPEAVAACAQSGAADAATTAAALAAALAAAADVRDAVRAALAAAAAGDGRAKRGRAD